jgi:RNA polymerase subunit RPABC4/transcription elongation factor Spt4
VTDEQKAEEAATETEQEGESFKEWVISSIAERSEKQKGLIIHPDAAMVCTLGCGEVIFDGSEICPRCGHQALTYREIEAMVVEDPAAEIVPYPVSIRGDEFRSVIYQDAAMVCKGLGCRVIFDGSEKCPRCGHQAETYSEIKARVFEALAAEIEPDPISKRKVLTRRIQ